MGVGPDRDRTTIIYSRDVRFSIARYVIIERKRIFYSDHHILDFCFFLGPRKEPALSGIELNNGSSKGVVRSQILWRVERNQGGISVQCKEFSARVSYNWV
jgi:hypothetical protein